jgi:hypothetical protein
MASGYCTVAVRAVRPTLPVLTSADSKQQSDQHARARAWMIYGQQQCRYAARDCRE